MRWEQLTESLSYTNIDEIPEKYKTIIDDYIASGNYIYRGMKGTSPYIIGNGSTGERKSKNTYNFYTTLIDNFLPQWKPYPKRSKSFICTTDSTVAFGYGRLYVVIPLDLQPIGICPAEDFWFGFKNINEIGLRSLNQFNQVLQELLRNTIDQYLPENPKTVSSVMDMLETYVKNTSQEEFDALNRDHWYDIKQVNDMFAYFKKHGVWKGLTYLFDPDINGFEVTTNIDTAHFGKNEVWLSDRVLFIHNDKFQDLMNNKYSKKDT